MSAAWVIVKTFWKPLAMLAVLLTAYGYGYSNAKSACKAANHQAENKELRRQLTAIQKVLKKTADESSVRAAENQELTKKVETYEQTIPSKPPFILSDDDAGSLHDIR